MTLTGPAVLLALAIILVHRKLHREFVFFFIYALFSIIFGILYEIVIGRPVLYFWIYWSSEAIDAILALLVLREVFHRVFPSPYANYRWFRFVLPITVLIILNISMFEMVYRPLGTGVVGHWVSAIYWFDLGVNALEGTILLLVLALTQIFPVAWRNHEFGILTGFGISACVTMLADLLRFLGGNTYETFFRYGPPIATLLATLIWLHAFLSPLQYPARPEMGWDEMLGIVRRSRELLEKMKKALGWRQQALAPPV